MRIKRLIKLLWNDIGMSPKELLAALGISVVISVPMFVVISALGWAAAKLANKPFNDEAISVGAALLILIFLAASLLRYLFRKWNESK